MRTGEVPYRHRGEFVGVVGWQSASSCSVRQFQTRSSTRYYTNPVQHSAIDSICTSNNISFLSKANTYVVHAIFTFDFPTIVFLVLTLVIQFCVPVTLILNSWPTVATFQSSSNSLTLSGNSGYAYGTCGITDTNTKLQMHHL